MSDAGCTAPSPKPGSTVKRGNTTVSCKVKYAVVGMATCTRKYKFVIKLDVAGPTAASFQSFSNTTGIFSGSLNPSVGLILEPGDYTATVSVTAQRTDSNMPACSQVKSLGSYSWGWKVKKASSSSSNSSSSGSGSGSPSSSSGSPSSGSSSSCSPSSSTSS